MRFVGRTVNGGIEATGLKADAEATTVNGGVELDSTGTARALTVNGASRARSAAPTGTGRCRSRP